MDHAAVQASFGRVDKPQRGHSFPQMCKSDMKRVQDFQWVHDRLCVAVDQIPELWNPHLKLEFIKMTLRSKALEVRLMRKKETSSRTLKEHINKIMEKPHLAIDDVDELDVLNTKLHEIEELEQEELSSRAGVKWTEEGAISTAFFLRKFKAKVANSTKHGLFSAGRHFLNIKYILAHVRCFY